MNYLGNTIYNSFNYTMDDIARVIKDYTYLGLPGIDIYSKIDQEYVFIKQKEHHVWFMERLVEGSFYLEVRE